MFKKVLIANRGAIACRIIRTLRKMGVPSVAVYSEADAQSLHVREADESLFIGKGPATESYLNTTRILEAALQSGAEAIHPGYGFLSENADFAEACKQAGLVFIGPTPEQMRNFGLKHVARQLASHHGVPMLTGSELLTDLESAASEARRIGYPVMLKSTAGGGGIGMQVCMDEKSLRDAFESVSRLAASAFKQSGVFLEKYVQVARHIEVQIFGDGKGNVLALGERDCSAQRRNQKVVEETPAPGITDSQRQALLEAARKLGSAVGYQSAGTVEFLFDEIEGNFYFLEVNTRLQVEHGVTEEVTGIDLVEWMIRQAAGELDLSATSIPPAGASIQVRLYAEDPNKDFQPSAGILTEALFPENIRVESWIERGIDVSPYYDPMLAKIISVGPDRATALARLRDALEHTRIAGIETNLSYLRQILASDSFSQGSIHTKWLASFDYRPSTIDVLEAGTQTSVQDYPGRIGYWAVGVPPSGPMDDYAFRLANRLAGNPEDAAGLEMTLTGPTLRFNTATQVALSGAVMEASLDGHPVPWWQAFEVKPGNVLKLGAIRDHGCRTYLAVAGGIDVPKYLGSRSTFSLGKFGGHAGRCLLPGDVLPVKGLHTRSHPSIPLLAAPSSLIPNYQSHWTISVLYGPHAAPEFFSEPFMDTFFQTDWKVHYNSNRLGIRLIGPKPEFTRSDGGEAGLHPSNIHDTEYAVGTINFTGDMPVILAKDGPSLGGFVCPVTIIQSELWKIGQLRPGDSIRFECTDYAHAVLAQKRQDAMIDSLADEPLVPLFQKGEQDAILHHCPATGDRPETIYRQAGDRYILIEYGPIVLDLEYRFRVHALMEWFREHPLAGIIELSPGVRSLQVNFDGRIIDRNTLLDRLLEAEHSMPPLEDMVVPSRIMHLPLSFDASSTREAIAKYRQSVRDEAPWLPSNVDFIRRINGLEQIEEVSDTVFKASYMVLGLGDVYLGAPCAVPVDPRHRLVTTKYNPARTWTAEGEVGIGGVYMCVYGMESPGGYQLIGRTVPVWNTYRRTAEFQPGHPWLLRFFDQVRFYPMPEKELLAFREAFRRGEVSLEIEATQFRVKDYLDFLTREAADIAVFKSRQQLAFHEERERWAKDGSADLNTAIDVGPDASTEEIDLPPEATRVSSPITGSVWALNAKLGQKVVSGEKIAIIEAMKMEVPVTAPTDGVVSRILIDRGKLVTAGQPMFLLEKEVAV
jgi:urea carboxylase